MEIKHTKGGFLSLFICLILVFTLLSTGVGVVAAADPIVSIKPAVKEVNVNEDFSVFIEVDPNGNAVETALLDLTYDSTKVSITAVVMNGVDFQINSPGDATVAGKITKIMGLNTAATGLTTVANLAEIQVHADAAGTFTVGISGKLTKPPKGNPLTPVTMNSGEVRIEGTGDSLEVTVLYPNGGESIQIGTQVQVRARAIDDNAVTGMTFYYLTGTSWNSIGTGTRVSGTDTDGTWAITWDTAGLGAGTNYKIKAVASDGTSTGEDQSDSAFSVIGTTPPAPTLNDPGTTDTDGSYTVSWSSVSGATSYTLEEDTSSSFGSPSVVHSGAGTSKDVSGKSDGTYYYRVQACNAEGCSGWSNVEAIVVSSSHTSVLTTIKVTPSTKMLDICETLQFTVMVYDQYDDVMSDIIITWTSSNATVGTISAEGLFTANNAGETTIVATNGTVSGTASVTVLNIQPEEEWNMTFGGTGYDWADSVWQTTDGGYILAGSTNSYGADFPEVAWLVKTDSRGNEQWNKTYGRPDGFSIALSVQQTLDGGYIFVGITAPYDGWMVKADFNGNTQWVKTFGGAEYEANSVQQTSDGGYILAGWKHSYGDDDGWMVKTDSNGNVQWEKTFGGTDYGAVMSVQQTSDGGYILAGETGTNGNGWLVKTDSNGNVQWEKTFGGTDCDTAESVQQTSDGGYIIAGRTWSYGAGSREGWLVKTDSNGNALWNTTFGGSGDDEVAEVQQTTDGGYILAGDTDSYGAGSADFWLIKVKGAGIISILDTGQSENPYPSIPGTHTGTITPSQDMTVQKLYTYPCAGTGGHTKTVRISGNGVDKSASWTGYAEERDTLTFDSSFTLEAGKTYSYVIETGSYPQIHHTAALQTENGWLNCTKFTDANGKEYDDWIPAIRLGT